MTYPAPDVLPYDEWFDPNYKYEPHPYDTWPMATDKDEKKKDVESELSLHEKMYRLATEKHNPWGSETFHTGGSNV